LKERKKEKSTYNNNKNKDLKHKNNETVTWVKSWEYGFMKQLSSHVKGLTWIPTLRVLLFAKWISLWKDIFFHTKFDGIIRYRSTRVVITRSGNSWKSLSLKVDTWSSAGPMY
jgi:hypothetical protein